MPYETLIDAAALAAFKGELRTFDCRAVLGSPGAGRAEYDAAHIPGAWHVDLETDLSGEIESGVTGRHPLPDPDRFAAKLGAWGVDETTQIIAYDAGSGAFAARLWWLARWLGHPTVAVLNGGLQEWQRRGFPVTTDVPRPPPRAFRRRAPLTREVDVTQVLDPGLLLLDARADARYRGDVEPIDKKAGHIPGALCAPFERNVDADGLFLSTSELRARFAALGAGDRPVVCYCGSGVTACHNVLALKLAGFDEAALYPGSWSEWITDPTRPIA